jgi:glucose-6-phosphate 1-epimerase
LSQHGFARNSRWEYLGKTSSESFAFGKNASDASVKLDFGLSDSLIDEKFKSAWPYAFGLTYSVTLAPGELSTSIQVANTGNEAIEFQTLFHTYLAIDVRYSV